MKNKVKGTKGVAHGEEKAKKAELLIKAADAADVPTPSEEKVKPSARDFKEKPPASDAERIAESRRALDQKLAPGQCFFEAPDGYVMIGEADRPHAWYREGNGGHGCWINPRR